MTTRRRQTLWVDTLHEFGIGSGTAVNVSLMGPLIPAESRNYGMTLIRTIICHDYHYTVHDSGEGHQVLDIGIAVAEQDAFSALALPDVGAALAEYPTRGWIYRCRHSLQGFAADQPAVDVRSVYRDIRAMRKLDNGLVYLQAQNAPGSGAASSVNVMGITRCLYLLS